MEVPTLGGELELQLLAYTTATATQDPGCICDLCHSLWQHQIESMVTHLEPPRFSRILRQELSNVWSPHDKYLVTSFPALPSGPTGLLLEGGF